MGWVDGGAVPSWNVLFSSRSLLIFKTSKLRPLLDCMLLRHGGRVGPTKSALQPSVCTAGLYHYRHAAKAESW